MIDHDRLFKELLSTFFVEFLELFFPQVLAYLEPASITFEEKEIFTDVTAGERYEADVVVKARLTEKSAIPVYPVVIFSYDAPRRAEPNIYRVEFPDKVVLEFNYAVIQLNRLNWRDFLQHENPVASALMAKMNIAPEDRPRVKFECLRLLATLRLDPARMQLISGFVDTYLRLSAEEQRIFQAEIGRFIPDEREVVMQIV